MTAPDRPPAFLFPGQLAEFVGMGRDFYDSDREARELFAVTSDKCGLDLEQILFAGPERALHENLAAQAGVYLVSTLAARALAREGITPPATAGYSLGNYAALATAGAISYAEGLDILIAVWRETERLGIRGAMGAVVGARREAVDAVCEDLRGRGLPVWIGNVNSSTQFVLTGTSPAVASALEALAPRALSVLRLTMTWPIHSELMEPVARAVAPVVAACRSIRDPALPFYGPDGNLESTAAGVARLLATEFCHPTLWNVTVGAMVRDGHRRFLEVGPGQMLSKILRWIDRSVACQPAGTQQAIGDLSRIFGGSS
jgi:[acyl-carrier-protein] S-malonyltransferase